MFSQMVGQILLRRRLLAKQELAKDLHEAWTGLLDMPALGDRVDFLLQAREGIKQNKPAMS